MGRGRHPSRAESCALRIPDLLALLPAEFMQGMVGVAHRCWTSPSFPERKATGASAGGLREHLPAGPAGAHRVIRRRHRGERYPEGPSCLR